MSNTFEVGDIVRHRCFRDEGRVLPSDERYLDRVMVTFGNDFIKWPVREVDLVLIRANGPSLRVIKGGKT